MAALQVQKDVQKRCLSRWVATERSRRLTAEGSSTMTAERRSGLATKWRITLASERIDSLTSLNARLRCGTPIGGKFTSLETTNIGATEGRAVRATKGFTSSCGSSALTAAVCPMNAEDYTTSVVEWSCADDIKSFPHNLLLIITEHVAHVLNLALQTRSRNNKKADIQVYFIQIAQREDDIQEIGLAVANTAAGKTLELIDDRNELLGGLETSLVERSVTGLKSAYDRDTLEDIGVYLVVDGGVALGMAQIGGI